jgi:hypothetical protein
VVIDDIINDIRGIAKALESSQTNFDDLQTKALLIIENLISDGFIEKDKDQIALSDLGNRLITESHTKIELLHDRFKISLKNRISNFTTNAKSIERVCNAAYAFLSDSIKHRSIGMLLSSGNITVHSKFHLTAILQNLPAFHSLLKNEEEAIYLNKLILLLLSEPNSTEKQFIGLTSQAQFGIHMLGIDESLIKHRLAEIKSTLFILDSSSLIPYIAANCDGHEPAKHLLASLINNNASSITTELLCEEVAEHARYAYGKVDKTTGQANTTTLASVTGQNGVKSNAFIEGLLENMRMGKVGNLFDYIKMIIKAPSLKNSDNVKKLLISKGLTVPDIKSFTGFIDAHYAEKDIYKEQIKTKRISIGNYRHERQVEAEGEVLLIVDMVRNGCYSLNGKKFNNAYFVSNTRIIDQITKSNRNVTMRADAVIHWFNTIQPFDSNEVSYLADCLAWELAERGLSIVSRTKIISVFGPLINASKHQLEEEQIRHRELIAERFGENGARAFNDVPDIYLPIVMEATFTDLAKELAKKLEEERKLRETIQNGKKMDEKAYAELSELKAKEARRIYEARLKARKGGKGKK